MRIEEITTKSLDRERSEELPPLRTIIDQLWKSNFHGNELKTSGVLGRNYLLQKYKILTKEMSKRGIYYKKLNTIESYIFNKSNYKFSVSEFGDLVIIPDFCSIAGSFVRNPEEAQDIDVVLRFNEEARDETLELKLGRALQKHVKKDIEFIYHAAGPHSSYISLFDLVLRPKDLMEIKRVKEMDISKAKKLDRKMKEHKEYEEESERIRRNAEQAKFPHPFMPAKWTHKNGHPRCLICGDEETLDGICRKFEKASITLGRPFTPLKSAGGYGKHEFGSIDELVKIWASGYLPDPGVAVETKFDGFRVQIHKHDKDVKIFSEDAKRDLSERLPDLKKEIQSFKDNFVLDGELLVYSSEGGKIDRKDMPTYIMSKDPPAFKAKIFCFDCLYYHNTPLDNNEWRSRQDSLSQIFSKVDELNVEKVVPTIAKTEARFRAAVKKHSEEKHSEGAMCKAVNSKYPLKGSTPDWAKFKNMKEIRARVVKVESKEGGGWIYTCEIQDGAPIGRTYATKIKAKVGDVLEIAVAEVKYDEKKNSFTWDNPIVRSLKPRGTALTTKEQAKTLAKLKRTKAEEKFLCECLECGHTIETEEHCIDLECPKCGGQMRRRERPGYGQLHKDDEGKGSEFGNIDFKVGDKGSAVIQIHIMGLSDEEAEDLKSVEKKIMIARQDPSKLQNTLHAAIGEHGAHIDMRLHREGENFWEGGEIMIGNISGLQKLKKLHTQGKLRFAWKQSRAGETKTKVVRGSLGWMLIGERSVHIFKPGESGASANQYASMIQMDKLHWEIYLADEHAKKIRFKNRYLTGNYLFAFVPVEGGKRVWMLSRLKETDYDETIQKRLPDTVPIFKVKEDEQIVGGIVYEPKEEDSQGDFSTEEEIRQACYYYMEHARRFKLQHEGIAISSKINILENYIAPQDLEIAKEKIKKGSWILIIRIRDAALWKKVKDGELTGFSMAGVAHRRKKEKVE